jgi:hypothetical protein
MSELLIKLRLNPWPTQKRFLESTASIKALIGPLGEGKTFAVAWAMFMHACKYRKYLTGSAKGFVIRDSHRNIKRNTVPSFDKAYKSQGIEPVWRDDYHVMEIGDTLRLEMIGIDNPGALNRIQGFEGFIGNVSEPEPMVNHGNAGIPLEVFQTAGCRINRPNAKPGMKDIIRPLFVIDMNPGDEESYSYELLVDNPMPAPDDMPWLRTETFFMERGENQELSEQSRKSVKMFYAGNQALLDRYYHGKFAAVFQGKAVTPEYNPAFHRAPAKSFKHLNDEIQPVKGIQGIRGWDFGHTPACVIAQFMPNGQLVILDVFTGDGVKEGVGQLIDRDVLPAMGIKYREVKDWIDVGDPSGSAGGQDDIRYSAFSMIADKLSTNVISGPTLWYPRRESVKMALSRTVRGYPMLYLSRHKRCKILHDALRGGWSYKVNNAGFPIGGQRAIPEKNKYSHPADALSYITSLIIPLERQENEYCRQALWRDDRHRSSLTGM